MNKCILGIDLGTSSVKLLARYFDGTIKKASASYENMDTTPVKSWIQALIKALKKLDCPDVSAIGLSSQVGTYIINDTDVISWKDGIGAEELKRLKEIFGTQEFIAHIAMPHPDIISYPLPRLLYIKEHYSELKSVCQPKDMLLKFLTGNLVTDRYSWRGLADPDTGIYSDYFLHKLGIDPKILPSVQAPESIAGYITKAASAMTGLPYGIPVYTGMNDFFASLAGMGITDTSCLFDITGTSEHLGTLTKHLNPNSRLVSGKYLYDFVHYGVTASSGASLSFCLKELGEVNTPVKTLLKNNPPVFTPYLTGERAPVFDADATGMFFGLNGSCTKEAMAYSVLEGVAFSLYHIYENLEADQANRIIVSGGASQNALLNQLKADLFGKEVVTLKENDTSALGAVMSAAVGTGLFQDYKEAARTYCAEDIRFQPDSTLQPVLKKRYDIYKQLYPALKNLMKEHKEANQ